MESLDSLDVLVIEDDPDTRTNLGDILELDDHRVALAGSAAEALARDDWGLFSAIILDRKLPDATADELLPRLRSVAPDAAVIVVTGYGDLQGAVSALRHGANDYILKPIEPDELRARLKRIAEGQRASRKLTRQAEIIRSLLENVSDAIVVADPQGTVLLSNPAVERLIGPMPAGAVPEEWAQSGRAYRSDAQTPYSLEELPLARALGGEQVVDEEVFLKECGSSSGQWTSVNASPIYEGAVIKGAVVIYRDISERKRAESDLRRQRDLAEGLIDAAPAIVLVLNSEGRVVRCNRFAEDLCGYRSDEVLGRDFFATFLPERDRSRLRDDFEKLLDELTLSGMVNPILTRDGRERTIRWSNRVLKDAEQRVSGVLAIGQDITDLREAQERALRAERLAAIGQTVTGLAHESRNALQRGQACLQMLALQVRDRPEALRLIDRLQQAQDHLHHLYEDVRSYAAPIRLERQFCDLSVAWREAWAHLESQRKDRSASLRERCDGQDLHCEIDPFRMEQVFRNIFENALAACADPVDVEARCTATDIDGRPAVCITIGDNGPGLTPENRQRIFEPFYTTKTKGTGLGMAIARRIIEAHGGQIITGDSTAGAQFVITLPRGAS